MNTIGSFTCSCSEEEIQDGDTCVGMSRLISFVAIKLSDRSYGLPSKVGRDLKIVMKYGGYWILEPPREIKLI